MMRIASLLPKIVSLALGVAIGGAGAWAIFAPPRDPAAEILSLPMDLEPIPKPTPMPTEPPPKGSSGDLGAKLLQLVGRNLIADDRAERDPSEPMVLYAQPKPYGETLCRVDVYSVAPKIVRGKALDDKEAWADDLKIETKYGLWKSPSAMGGDRNKACADYRDFAHLIEEKNMLSAARGTFVMNTILTQAKAGKFGFKVNCTRISVAPEAKPMPCDPLAVLRVLTLKDIYRTEMLSERENEQSATRRDSISVASDKIAHVVAMKNISVEIRIDDEQLFGKYSIDEADVRSVEILIAQFC